ncbi:undecaprenyldiphospho-muramoylpentapeptide beta-N-acetylglucosaminyltransferase [Verrucomicrobiota bacterium]
MADKGHLKIGIACGGTGGHIFPGLATARALRRRGHEVMLWLVGRDLEPVALEGWEGKVVTVHARGFSSRFSPRNAGVLWSLFLSVLTCARTMKRSRPDVLLAMGSYASVGPVLAAKRLGIPVVLHEANVVPGRAIRLLSPVARTVAIGFEETRQVLRHKHVVLTGMPLREAAREDSSDELWNGLKDNGFTVLIMGGSRGAHTLNMMGSSAVIRLYQEARGVQVIHLTGSSDEAVIRAGYERVGVPHAVFGFLGDVRQAYRRAALAVCRSGASTCAELSCYGVPALLVPYPFATHQHQLANARALEKSGSADVRKEDELTEEWIVDYLRGHVSDHGRLESMKEAARNRVSEDAASALADLVEEAAGHYAERGTRNGEPIERGSRSAER